jgi:hypothetical protein
MNMDDEKRVTAFIELYRQQMERYRQTQDVEWKVNLSIYASLAGAIYFIAQHPLQIGSCIAILLFLIIPGLIPFMHAWWLWKIHDSEQAD